MTSISNPFRKQDPPKPLHSRWGDVAITVPTAGSWSQYTPRRLSKKPKNQAGYGPGFVPEDPSCPPDRCLAPSTSDEDENESISTDTSSSSRRNSFRINPLNPRRISTRLALHAPRMRDTIEEREHLVPDHRRNEFAYKPIRHDYLAEVAESQGSSSQQRHRTNTSGSTRFRYIPANLRYREEFADIPQRSQSASSCRSRSSHSPTFSDGVGGEQRSRSRLGSLGRGEKRVSVSKSVTTATMVPDPDDLYE